MDHADAEAVGLCGVAAAEPAAAPQDLAVADADVLGAVAREADVGVRTAQPFRLAKRHCRPLTVFRIANRRPGFLLRVECA
jgi:hypothetical protein